MLQTTTKNQPSHLKALLKKNWILWKRSWFVSLLEIVIPVLLAIVMLGISKAVPSKDVPETTYINNPATNIAYDGTLSASDLQYIKDCSDPERGGKIALAPAGDNIITTLNGILTGADFETELFLNDQQIDEFVSQSNYGTEFDQRICFAVVMNKNDINNQYEYFLRFNVSDEPFSDLPSTLNTRIKYLSWEDTDSLNKYAKSGFLVMQNLIDNLILNQEITPNTGQIQANVSPRSVAAHVQNDIASNLVGYTRIFFDLPLRLPFLRFMNFILVEKEKRIREGMKIMGLKNTAFYLSWMITYTIIFTIISLIVSGFLTAGLFQSSSYGFVFLWHWEYSLCLMMAGFFLSVFFNNAKRGVIASLVITVALGFLQVLADEESSSSLYSGLSFIPPASMGIAADHILRLEGAQVGLTSATVNQEILNNKMTYHYRSMVIDFFIFLILGAYLDQVLPSEFGIRKSPVFFVKYIKQWFSCIIGKKKVQDHHQDIEEKANIYEDSGNFETTEQILKAQDDSNESVRISALKKVYGSRKNEKVAVNGVSFSMYKNQIFALLGHNGAGKTTTISMITGLIQPTAGTTKIFGKDLVFDLDEARKSMGICPQHDVLFDNLTVKEHLELFAVFKGMNKKDIPQEIDKIIHDIGLSEKRNYLAKNLSGGQKRKLSVGIAFIGGSKFILLDEPSSGMDTFARRKLWDLLKNYKQDRVILLTTHFMDEADYLGDRIGIMADGQLKCLGSSLFLKTKFGVGYSLTLIKKDINTISQPIIQLIQNQVSSAKVTSDVSAELTLQLPLEESNHFQDLFLHLDENLEKLGITSYGISVTTLEEVFLNVAKLTTTDHHLQKLPQPKEEEEDGQKYNLNNNDDDARELKEKRIRNPWSLMMKQFSALTIKRYHYTKRDKKGLIIEFLIPVIIALIGINTANSKQSNNDLVSLSLADSLYNYQFTVDYNSLISGTATDPDFINNFNPNYFQMTPVLASSLDQLDQEVLQSQGTNVLDSQVNVFNLYVQELDQSNNNYQYTALVDTRAQEAAPFAVNKINNAIIKYATGNPNKQINVFIAPLPKTQRENTAQNRVSGIFYAFGFGLGLSFIAGSLIVFIVKEREVNAKHQQIVSGASLPAYWFSNFFFDYLKYLIPAILCAIIAIATDASALIDDGKIGGMWAIFLLYGVALIPFTYLSSFLFKNYGSAQVASFFFNFATGFIAGVSVGMLRSFEDTNGIAMVLQWILRPLPTFAMTYGFFNLANREVYFILGTESTILDVFDIRLIGGDILFLILGAIVYTLLLFLVENLKNKKSFSNAFSKKLDRIPYIPKKLDDDVEREMNEVATSDNKTYSIKVDKLRKVYALGKGKTKVAVDRLSFGVKNGECFALLGVNGAGKTTTFKILSGDVIQTDGKAFINGFEIPDQLNEARHDIGYCPQFDALLENLTAKEHLNLYAAIKGIPLALREKCVQRQLVEMNLKQYENILAGTYSGGNKRKLSVAIAMIGDPSVVFLDEPSTGMDPEARRFMWNVISRISKERKQSSVILTTHSMEEAEALATKMGIMVNGNLKCLGTSQHIKNKFGGGYEIEIKLNLPTQAQINQTIESLGLTKNTQLDRNNFEEILMKLNASDLKDEISETGSGSAIHSELQKGHVSIDSAIEWILLELNGRQLKAFLTENFGDMKLLEHFQAFYRFRSNNKISIGNFFGILEKNKHQQNILQYSICQSTIEQIFNGFAAEQDIQEQNLINIDVQKSKEIDINIQK